MFTCWFHWSPCPAGHKKLRRFSRILLYGTLTWPVTVEHSDKNQEKEKTQSGISMVFQNFFVRVHPQLCFHATLWCNTLKQLGHAGNRTFLPLYTLPWTSIQFTAVPNVQTVITRKLFALNLSSQDTQVTLRSGETFTSWTITWMEIAFR